MCASRRALFGLIAAVWVLASASPALAKPTDRALVTEYANAEASHLGEPLPGGPETFIQVVESTKHNAIVHEYGETYPAAALTEPIYNASQNEVIGAKITIYGEARSFGENIRRGVIAHEVFHIFEARMARTYAADHALKGWLVEGAANWVESDLVSGDRSVREWWRRYLTSPKKELFTRTYDAVGFFGHMASSGISPWTRFKAMFQAGSSEAAWNAAVGGQSGYLDSEASSFFREPRFGGEWEQTGQNVPSAKEARAKPAYVTVGPSSKPVKLVAAAHADGMYNVSIKTAPPTKAKPVLAEPAVEVELKSGNARIAATEGGGINEAITGDILLCSDPKGCSAKECPKHYAPFLRGDIAITGGDTGGLVTLTRRKPCESEQPERSCETLLPGFTTEVAQGIGQTVGNPGGLLKTLSTPGGSYVSECLFLTKDATVDEAGEFKGAFAFVMVLRAPTVDGAELFYEDVERTPGLTPVKGYGEEALISVKQTTGAGGEEYDGEALIRVGNEVAFFGVYSTPGNDEGDEKHLLALLSKVAGEI